MLARHARRMREDARGVAKLNAASNVTPPVGYVYVIVNEGMPGLVKVGYSSRRPGKRAEELSSTGNPYRYKVAFYLSSANPYEVEQLAHEYLRKFSVGERAAGVGVEWFRCEVKVAIEAIKKASEGSRCTAESFERWVQLTDSLAEKEKLLERASSALSNARVEYERVANASLAHATQSANLYLDQQCSVISRHRTLVYLYPSWFITLAGFAWLWLDGVHLLAILPLFIVFALPLLLLLNRFLQYKNDKDRSALLTVVQAQLDEEHRRIRSGFPNMKEADLIRRAKALVAAIESEVSSLKRALNELESASEEVSSKEVTA